MSIGENHIAKETREFVVCRRLYQWLFTACDNFRGVIQVEQQGPEAIAVLFIGPVIDFQPSVFCLDRRGSGTYASAIPIAFARSSDALMIAPMNQIGRFGDPYIIAA